MEQTSSQIAVYFLKASGEKIPLPSCFTSAKESIAQNSAIELKTNATVDEMLYAAKSGKKCILVFSSVERQELAVTLNAIMSLKQEIKTKKVVSLVFLKLSSDKIEETLMKSGCSEILKFDLNARAFSHKIGRYLKMLEQEAVNSGDAIVELTGKAAAATATTELKALKGGRDQSIGFQIEMFDAWDGINDFWLFRKKAYAKKYRDQWLIEMIGPAPSAGYWEKMNTDHYRWKSRNAHDFFDVSPAQWEWTGKEPQYSWVINRWGFVSKSPYLVLLTEGRIECSRFFLKDPNTIVIARNSDYAKSIFPQIKETYDKTYWFEGEIKKTKEMSLSLTPEEEISWNDKVNSDSLSTADWNQHDSQDAAEKNWNDHRFQDDDFLMGAEALKDCGLSGKLKNITVDLLEYNESAGTITVGLNSAQVNFKEVIEVEIEAANLELKNGTQIRGVVNQMIPIDGGAEAAVVILLQSSNEDFRAIKNAVARRQAEIFAFFKKVKGA